MLEVLPPHYLLQVKKLELGGWRDEASESVGLKALP
jgi:hypothetical protein